MLAIGGPFDGEDIGGEEQARVSPYFNIAHQQPLKFIDPDKLGDPVCDEPCLRYSTYVLAKRWDGKPFWKYIEENR